MIDTKKVGTTIQSFRKNMNYTQDRLAELLRVSPQAVSKWENGHTLPDTYLLPAIARIFDCTIDRIIMSAVAFDSDAQGDIQAERIAARVVEKIENKKENALGFDDTTISEAVIKRHNITGYVTVIRGKTSKAAGHIKTPITVSAPHNDIELTELVYHKRDNEFRGYALLNDYISELPFVYYIDHSKKALLLESLDETHFKG
ncbi:MAG: helix-turn-helix domain-containing protein, partial [Clostridiales bacterium]|nr:helix-turn-helix domain-containing protein [Clostridiales bacterium]